ncbi:hypothetical protein HMPREF5505_1933 [Lactobacillus delbrueckii subsp. lactis DSM 20072]|nr:hypothetical protein HMPREF5505_1933 [Lactobacillus delbrueckii subsp. lactis DSM 20072]
MSELLLHSLKFTTLSKFKEALYIIAKETIIFLFLTPHFKN